MVTCSFDELTVLHLLRGATWPAIQTGPVKTSLCFRNSSPNWQLERSCRSESVGSFGKCWQHVSRTTGMTVEVARCSWGSFFEKPLHNPCAQANQCTCRLNEHFVCETAILQMLEAIAWPANKHKYAFLSFLTSSAGRAYMGSASGILAKNECKN